MVLNEKINILRMRVLSDQLLRIRRVSCYWNEEEV